MTNLYAAMGRLLILVLFIPGFAKAQKIVPAHEAASFYADIPDSAKALIQDALPGSAGITSGKTRNLLVFNLHKNGDKIGRGHPSIPYANYMFMMMGRQTGAWETWFSRDTMIFMPEVLQKFDAICFNNTAGVLFDDTVMRNNLLEYIYSGRGFVGIHAAGATFCQWPVYDQFPEYGEMLGGYENGGHPWKPHEWITLKVDETDHPVNRAFHGESFKVSDEVFQFSEPFSRDRLRILLSIDTGKTDMSEERRILPERRADGDLAISWVRNYGRGRVFYTSLGHNCHINWNPVVLQHYLDGIRFAMGDLEAPATPSNKLTPAIRAQETLGWRLGLTAYSFRTHTLFETIDTAASMGIRFLGGLNVQKVSHTIPKNFDFNLTDEELGLIRKKFLSDGVTLVTYYVHDIPEDEADCKKLFEFGRKIGIETFISEPEPDALDMIEKFCREYDIRLAIHNHGADISPVWWDPQNILKHCRDRSPLIGACGDFGTWARSGILPSDAVHMLNERLITIQMHDLNEFSPGGEDVAWGSGVLHLDELLKSVGQIGTRLSLFGLEFSRDWDRERPEILQSIEYFNNTTIKLNNDKSKR
jgi:type 1 glutamine amidotransferase/sugar phosphate isomerase/epimerase